MGSTRREGGVPAYVNLSASSMLMIAMQYTSNPGKTSYWLFLDVNIPHTVLLSSNEPLFFFFPVYHCQLLECLMKHKQEVWKVHIATHDNLLKHDEKIGLKVRNPKKLYRNCFEIV